MGVDEEAIPLTNDLERVCIKEEMNAFWLENVYSSLWSWFGILINFDQLIFWNALSETLSYLLWWWPRIFLTVKMETLCSPSRRALMGTAQAQRGPTHVDRAGTVQLAIVGFKQFWTRALYSNCAVQPMSNPRWPMPNPHYLDGIGIQWV